MWQSTEGPTSPGPVAKTDEEWRRELSPEAYRVLRRKGTERPSSGALWDNPANVDSGTGWPSFWAPVRADSVAEQGDTSWLMHRTEVTCGRCGSHLGHVFDDGPEPTGLRSCINSVALRFERQP